MNRAENPTRGRLGLRWKLTLSYTAVTVGALIAMEIIVLVLGGGVLLSLVRSGTIPAQVIETASISYTPILRAYLSQNPPDTEGLDALIEQAGSLSISIPISFDATDRLFVLGPDRLLLAASATDLFGPDQIGRSLDPHILPGLEAPLAAALSGEDDPSQLFTLGSPSDPMVLVIPVWDDGHENVLGVLGALAEYPTITSILGDSLPLVGASLLILTLVAGLIGTLFGYVAARGPVRRLDRLSVATGAWSRGDFTEFVDDDQRDELGLLAQQLNRMAQELEGLMETRRDLAVAEERNRLARELHDSAKQLAFAAAARIGGVRALLPEDPEAAAAHLTEAETLLDDLRKELTAMILELRPVALSDEGLASATRNYVTDWAGQNEIEFGVEIRDARPLSDEVEQTFFRVLQEALANIARHSEASRVDVELAYGRDYISLQVSDDGHGFDVEGIQSSFGLNSMRQRAESLGGNLTIRSAEGEGTTVSCKVPVAKQEAGIESTQNG